MASFVPLMIYLPGTPARCTLTTIGAVLLGCSFFCVYAPLWTSAQTFQETFDAAMKLPPLPPGATALSLDGLTWARSSALMLFEQPSARVAITGLAFCPQIVVLVGRALTSFAKTFLGRDQTSQREAPDDKKKSNSKDWTLSVLSMTLVAVVSTYRAPVTVFTTWPLLPRVSEAFLLGTFALEVGSLHKRSDPSVLWFVDLQIFPFAATVLATVLSQPQCESVFACAASGSVFTLADFTWAALSVAALWQHYRLQHNWCVIATCVALAGICVLPESDVLRQFQAAEENKFAAFSSALANVELCSLTFAAFGGGMLGAASLMLSLHLTFMSQASIMKLASL